jgi:hypothetical protein
MKTIRLWSLDVDGGKHHMTLALQLLNDPRLNGRLEDLFHLEHHPFTNAIIKSWKSTLYGTSADSMQVFQSQ